MMKIKGSPFSDRKSVHRLIALFASLSAVVLFMAWCGTREAVNRFGSAQRDLSKGAKRNAMTLHLRSDLERCRADLLMALFTVDTRDEFAAARMDFDLTRSRFRANCDAMAKEESGAVAGGEHQKTRDGLIPGIKEEMEGFASIGEILLDSKEKHMEAAGGGGSTPFTREERRLVAKDLSDSANRVRKRIDELLAESAAGANQARAQLGPIGSGINTIFAITVFIALLLSILLGIAAAGRMKRGVGVLNDLMNRAVKGDLTARVATELGEELGGLGAGFNSMTEKFSQMISRINRTTEELKHVSSTLA
jgi:HAMP domain-containing protein